MADEINITTNEPEAVRAEIATTRARMSETIDEIEDALVRKKERIQDRLDVLSPVREHPFRSVGIVFGAGLLMGLITGGGGEDEEEYEYSGDWTADDRARKWENRARRLLEIARDQEEELEAATGKSRLSGFFESDDDENDYQDEDGSFGLGEMIGERVADFFANAIEQFKARRA